MTHISQSEPAKIALTNTHTDTWQTCAAHIYLCNYGWIYIAIKFSITGTSIQSKELYFYLSKIYVSQIYRTLIG